AGAVGQLAHAHAAVLGLGQPHEHLVVGMGEPCVALELAVDGLEQQLGRLQIRPPGPLLLRRQPPEPRLSHGSDGTGIVEASTPLEGLFRQLKAQLSSGGTAMTATTTTPTTIPGLEAGTWETDT